MEDSHTFHTGDDPTILADIKWRHEISQESLESEILVGFLENTLHGNEARRGSE